MFRYCRRFSQRGRERNTPQMRGREGERERARARGRERENERELERAREEARERKKGESRERERERAKERERDSIAPQQGQTNRRTTDSLKEAQNTHTNAPDKEVRGH